MSFLSKLFKREQKIPTKKRKTGDEGEQIASEYLSSLGYNVIRRNVRISHKEIDIIAENDDYTVIVEVKTISASYRDATQQCLRPSDNITRAKIQNILYAAKSWCTRNYTGKPPRIDVIEVYLGDTPPKVVHIENAINNRALYRKRR